MSADNSLRALLEQPRQLLTVAFALVAALLIGFELKALVDTGLTAEQPASPRTPSASSDPVATVTGAGLFGTPALTSPGDDALLPQTSMQLILRGVFTGNSPEQGSAIFELPDGNTRMARAGGSLGDDVVLERIYPGRVVLNRNGLQEYLTFPSTEEYAEAAAAIATPADTATAPATETLDEDEKRANILRRLEELRARSLERTQG